MTAGAGTGVFEPGVVEPEPVGDPVGSGWVIQLDPTAIAPDRTMLDLNDGPITCKSVDWGDAEVTAYQTQEGQYGNSVADFVLPNRTITFTLGLGMDDGINGVTEEEARARLQQKVGLLQREGGQMLRQRAGGPAMYADIVEANLAIPDEWGETGGIEDGVTLVLQTLPDFYGDEITLDTITATGAGAAVLQSAGSQAVIKGDYPARARLIVTDTSGNDQHGLLWGVRSRYHDSASTAALFYEAESMTPLNGAASAAVSGMSGGHAIEIVNPPAGVWVPMLATTLTSGGPLTHQGSYRVWARCKATGDTPQFRLVWGVGSLSAPRTNDAVQLPSADSYVLDFGTVRLDKPPVGAGEWVGVFQVYGSQATATDYIDCIYLQPLDESAGQLTYSPVTPASSIGEVTSPTTVADDASAGTVAWSNPGNATAWDDSFASATTASGGFHATHYLKATGFGLSVPAGATIAGIEALVVHWATVGLGGARIADAAVRLVKAGTVQTPDRSAAGPWPQSPVLQIYGTPTDLWGGTWTPTDINDAGFGVAIVASLPGQSPAGAFTAYVDYMQIRVWYTLASGFTVAQDAVVYADKIAELRSEGMYRTQDGTVYGRISKIIGDLPRLPPSGAEARPVELFVKPSRGDLGTLADSGLDGFQMQVRYRPCYLARA